MRSIFCIGKPSRCLLVPVSIFAVLTFPRLYKLDAAALPYRCLIESIQASSTGN